MTNIDRAYLSIVSWPAACDDATRMDVFTGVLGADAFSAKEWMRRRLPAVFKREEMPRAAELVTELQARGVVALAVPVLSIRAQLQPRAARAIVRSADGLSYTLDLGRAGEATVDAKSIVLLVRAHVRDYAGHEAGDFGVQALHQLQGTFSAEDWSQGHTGRRRLNVAEVVDIHSAEGPHWRIIGGHCAVAGVPDGEPSTSRDSLGSLVKQIVRDNPQVKLDTRFEEAHFIAEIAPDFGVTGDWRSMGGFDVYSAWLRHLEGAGVLT